MSQAITASLMVLGFLELPDDERPPEEIWHHAERLNEWFDAVRQRRANPDMQPVETFDEDDEKFMRNEAFDELTGGLNVR